MPDHAAARDYKAFVGPADQYDLIGAAQFALLYALGLRAHHRLLDIGCGSLRAGRMLIAYLDPERYVGVEPNRWLIDDAVEREIGSTMLTIKRPTFDAGAEFSLSHLGRFDFVLAQGIATNTGPRLLTALLAAIEQTLAPAGLGAVTFIHPGSGDREAVPVQLGDSDVPGWRYPGCYSYARAEIATAIAEAGLVGEPIGWHHPRHTWWLLAHTTDRLPAASFRAMLNGATLADGGKISLGELSEDDVESILSWRYGGEYTSYDLGANDRAPLIDPANVYFAIRHHDELIGYVCVGAEARVAGMTEDPDVVDLGVGVRPDLTGRSHSRWLMPAVLAELDERLGPVSFRAVIKDWNQRAQRAAVHAGFHRTGSHDNAAGPWVLLRRDPPQID